MGLKTFNIDDEIHARFKDFCDKNSMSMSKKIEKLMKQEIAGETGISVSENDTEKKKGPDSHPLEKYC